MIPTEIAVVRSNHADGRREAHFGAGGPPGAIPAALDQVGGEGPQEDPPQDQEQDLGAGVAPQEEGVRGLAGEAHGELRRRECCAEEAARESGGQQQESAAAAAKDEEHLGDGPKHKHANDSDIDRC